MKEKLTSVLSIILCAVMVAAALCIGAVTGWQDERDSLSASSELLSSLRDRSMDAVNLAVVAARHVGEDDVSVQALRSAYSVLQQEKPTLAQLREADAAIASAAQDLNARLSAMPSVQESARDSAYVATLARSLSGKTGAAAITNAQEDFNKRMSASLTGRLAMLLGVEPFAAEVTAP